MKPTLSSRTLEGLRAEIQEQVDDPGPYSNNIVSVVLRQIKRKYGKSAANAAVRELDLTAVFSIHEIP